MKANYVLFGIAALLLCGCEKVEDDFASDPNAELIFEDPEIMLRDKEYKIVTQEPNDTIFIEINEPNEIDIENARKLGGIFINYADYAQGKIDCNEYVRRGTLLEKAWNWSEPNDQTTYYDHIFEDEPNEPERLIEFEYSM